MADSATEAVEHDVETALARAVVYRLLGGAFGYPSPVGLGELERLAVAAAGGPLGASPLRELLLGLVEATHQANARELAHEYVFLFDRQARCPPYEGAYGEAQQMAGKAPQLADVAGFYAAFGLEPAAARPDAEDHIAAELEFTGTNTGPMMIGGKEIPPTGKSVVGGGMYFARVQDGKVIGKVVLTTD